MGATTSRLTSLVWAPSANARGFVALTNLGGHDLHVSGAGRGAIQLGPRATNVVELSALASGKAGWPALISLRHDGAPGALSAVGIVFNEAGFSSTLRFVDPGEAASNTLAGAHFYSGPAPDNLGLPQAERFSAILSLANTSASPTQAVVSVDYTTHHGANHVQIANPFLGAAEVSEIDATERLHALGTDTLVDAGLEVSYTGAPGIVIAKLVSLDGSGDLAFDTPVRDPQAGMYRSSGAHPWRVDGGFNTIVVLKNVLSRAVYAMVVLRFDGGQYTLPRVALEPFQTVSLNLREVTAGGRKDLDGNSLPASGSGKVLWFQEEPDSLIGRAEIYNVQEGVAASYGCFYPCNCNLPYFTPNTSDTWLSPSSLTLGYLQTQLIATVQRRYDCNNSNLGSFDISSSTVYSSGNTGIFKFTGSSIQAVSVGSGSFSGQAPRNTETPPYCPAQSQANPSGTGKVTPTIWYGGSDVTNQKTTVIVGQQIALSTQYSLPTGLSVQSQSWSVQGNVIANYTQSSTSAVVTSYSSPNATTTTFYWIASGANTVTYSVTLSDGSGPFAASTTFSVLAPTATITNVVGAVQVCTSNCVGTAPTLGLGNGTTYGITWTTTVTTPLGGAGSVALTQLIEASNSITLDPQGTVQTLSTNGAYVLDTTPQYAGQSESFPASKTGTFALDDSPGISLQTNLKHALQSKAFTTDVMYQPSGANSIWVTLASMTWSWSGAATKGAGNVWALDSSPPPAKASSGGVASTTLPVWSSNITSYRFQ